MAVMNLLEDKEWSRWSDSEVARRCHVTYPFVLKLRSSLVTVTSEKSDSAHVHDQAWHDRADGDPSLW